MSIREIREQLAASALRPQRRFGQNFLHDRNMACWIVDFALRELSPPWRVWEIGPGLGMLTQLLLERGASVRAVEIDRGLAAILRARFRGVPRFDLYEGDALRGGWPAPVADWIVVSNLPYSISGPFLASLFQQEASPRRVVVTLQREVAERLAAHPRQDAYGSLSVMGQSCYRIEIRKRLPASVFYPAPKVESALVCLEPLDAAPIGQEERKDFCTFVRKSFQQRRKSLGRRWGHAERRRPEELSVGDWISAYREWRRTVPRQEKRSFDLT